MTIEYIEARAGALGEITTFLNLGALFRHWQARRSVRHLASLDDYVLRTSASSAATSNGRNGCRSPRTRCWRSRSASAGGAGPSVSEHVLVAEVVECRIAETMAVKDVADQDQRGAGDLGGTHLGAMVASVPRMICSSGQLAR